ncbi:MAG: hypothetical protein AAB384_03475 [Patescibacteria group bacterium]
MNNKSLRLGQSQEVLVTVVPDGIIPLHTHACDADMYIVSGDAIVLSTDQNDDGQAVSPGYCVRFAAGVGHGFRAGPGGLSFVSRNGGIVDETGEWDIQLAAA